MNCSQLRSRISELLDEELSYSDSQIFHQHLDSCNTCSDIYAGLGKTMAYLLLQPNATLSGDFVERLQDRIKYDAARGPSLWQRATTPRIAGLSPLWASGLAAAAVSAIIVGSSLFQVETAPIINIPQSSASQLPATTTQPPGYSVPVQPRVPSQVAATIDSIGQRRDTSRRDFSKQVRLVDQKRP